MCPKLTALTVNRPCCFPGGLVLILLCQVRLLKRGSSPFFLKSQRLCSCFTAPRRLVAVVKNDCGADVKGGIPVVGRVLMSSISLTLVAAFSVTWAFLVSVCDASAASFVGSGMML